MCAKISIASIALRFLSARLFHVDATSYIDRVHTGAIRVSIRPGAQIDNEDVVAAHAFRSAQKINHLARARAPWFLLGELLPCLGLRPEVGGS